MTQNIGIFLKTIVVVAIAAGAVFGANQPSVKTVNANDYSHLETAVSNRLLTENDLRDLSKQQLRLLRNTVFARHGYKFAAADLQEYFGKKKWYRPQYDEVTHLLNTIERENVQFIQKYEVRMEASSSVAFTDNRDGRTYKTVRIGNHRWMAENLNYRPQIGRSTCSENNNSNCNKYGRLYDWNTAKIACPTGWHLPSTQEWDDLMLTVGGKRVSRLMDGRHEYFAWDKAGMKLKAKIGWGNKGNGTDDYGFSALPGGIRYYDGSGSTGKDGYWWTTTESNDDKYIHSRYIDIFGDVREDINDPGEAISVRCVEGEAVVPIYKQLGAGGSGTVTDKRDGQKYKTVKIGNQWWMAENLNYQPQSGNSWCYENNNSNCSIYGRLYDWNTARIVCPSGWHLPSRLEWNNLVKVVGPSVAGKKLKAKKGWTISGNRTNNDGWDNDGNGTDEYGFSALPGGLINSKGGSVLAGYDGYWWTATEEFVGSAFYRSMENKRDNTIENSWENNTGYSVRCVQDNDEIVKTIFGINLSHTNGRHNMFWFFFFMFAVIVFASIIAKFKIPPYLEKVRRTEIETKKDTDRAINAVEHIKNKFNDLMSVMKNAMSVCGSATARELLEEAFAMANKLVEPINDAVALSVEIANIRLKRKLAAFEKSVAISEQAERMVKRLDKEVNAARDLYDRAMREEEIARKEETAETGDVMAKYDVSKWYLNKENNFERYVYWLRKSAEHGYTVAQLELGTMYFEGTTPLKKDINEALVWLEKAAGKDGLPPMTKDAANWFRLHCNTEDMDFNVLLRLAVRDGRKDIMEWIFSLHSDLDVNNEDENGSSLLHDAAFKGHINVMEFLIDHGADVEAENATGKTPLFMLATMDRTEAMKWLVRERGANVEARNNKGRTPIFSAVDKRNIESIKCLKNLGASILVRDSDGLSPMDYAAGCGHLENIKCLAQLGANVNAKRSNGQTPMFSAAASGKVEVIKCLVDLGADVNATDNDGLTPMFMAAQAGQPESIICLKELGADITASDSVGMTPIFMAAGSGKPANIECLVSLGANVNTKSKNGMTPIFLAAAEGQLESVKCLVALGADVNVETNGMTPLTLAEESDNTDVEEYLCTIGAR